MAAPDDTEVVPPPGQIEIILMMRAASIVGGFVLENPGRRR
jgi:hypothetical protein